MLVTEFDIGGQLIPVLSAHGSTAATPAWVQVCTDELEVMLQVCNGRPCPVMAGDFNPRDEPDPAAPAEPVLLRSQEDPRPAASVRRRVHLDPTHGLVHDADQ